MIEMGHQVGFNKSKRVSALTNAYLPCIYYYLNWEIMINYWKNLLKYGFCKFLQNPYLKRDWFCSYRLLGIRRTHFIINYKPKLWSKIFLGFGWLNRTQISAKRSKICIQPGFPKNIASYLGLTDTLISSCNL